MVHWSMWTGTVKGGSDSFGSASGVHLLSDVAFHHRTVAPEMAHMQSRAPGPGGTPWL